MPKGLGFDTEHRVIIIVNLLAFFDQEELEYQVEYPLTRGNKWEGVIGEDIMRNAIDASIERGHVVEIVPEEDEATPHCTNATVCKKGKSKIFIIEAFTQLTTIEVWYLWISPRRKCCLRSRQSANLERLQKTC